MKKAFSLAEVLITLAILGVVAAMTAPTLIANYKEQEIKSLLKKNHSVISQALYYYYYDYGIVATGKDFESRTFKEVFKTHFNILKDYGNNGFYFGNKNYELYENYNGTNNLYYYLFDDGQFILNDGTFIMIENPDFGNGNNRVFIAADVNGPGKKPNKLGRDLFIFQVSDEGKLLPMGAPGTYYLYPQYCSETSTSDLNGAACTFKYITKY